MKKYALSTGPAIALFAVAVTVWGVNWVVMKLTVASIHPIWVTAIRSAIAMVVLYALLTVRGQMVLPKRGDYALIVVVAVLHMVCFSTLVAYGVSWVPVGRSLVLSYTTPLWVAPAAWLFLKEPISKLVATGIGIGLFGVALLFSPGDFDWHDRQALLGNGLLILAAVAWAGSIVYTRAHHYVSSPLQLVFWQSVLATVILCIIGSTTVGVQEIVWTPTLALQLLFSGVCATALAFWAMLILNRSLPATTTALGFLATPFVGIVSATLYLDETLEATVVVSMLLVLGGIAIGTLKWSALFPHRRD